MRFGDPEALVHLDHLLRFVDFFNSDLLLEHLFEHAMILLHHCHQVFAVSFIGRLASLLFKFDSSLQSLLWLMVRRHPLLVLVVNELACL